MWSKAGMGGFRPGPGESRSETDFGGLTEPQLGALAYATPIPALALLLFDPYRRNGFLRFHSYQCLLLTLAAILVATATSFIAFFTFPGSLVAVPLQFALLGLWLLAAYKAWQGQEYRLPIIGHIAAEHARDRS